MEPRSAHIFEAFRLEPPPGGLFLLHVLNNQWC
jgi:hypothetical protein